MDNYCVIAKNAEGTYEAKNGVFEDYTEAREFKATIAVDRCPMIIHASKLEHALLLNNK